MLDRIGHIQGLSIVHAEASSLKIGEWVRCDLIQLAHSSADLQALLIMFIGIE